MKQVDLQRNVYDIGIEANEFSDNVLEQILQQNIERQKEKIERLNNNWNELEKWIEKERDKWEKYNPNCFVYYQSILDRIKELKGSDKE